MSNNSSLSEDTHLKDELDAIMVSNSPAAPVVVVGPKVWSRRLLSWVITGAITVLTLSLLSVTFALVVTNSSRNDLQNQLTCRAKPIAVVDHQTAADLAALGSNQAAIGAASALTLNGLAALSSSDKTALDTIIKSVPAQIATLNDSSTKLRQTATDLQLAVDKQDKSIELCNSK